MAVLTTSHYNITYFVIHQTTAENCQISQVVQEHHYKKEAIAQQLLGKYYMLKCLVLFVALGPFYTRRL